MRIGGRPAARKRVALRSPLSVIYILAYIYIVIDRQWQVIDVGHAIGQAYTV